MGVQVPPLPPPPPLPASGAYAFVRNFFIFSVCGRTWKMFAFLHSKAAIYMLSFLLVYYGLRIIFSKRAYSTESVEAGGGH